MVELIVPPRECAYKSEGDPFWADDELASFLMAEASYLSKYKRCPLTCFFPNPIKALPYFGIHTDEWERFAYKDVYTEQKCFAAIPRAILSPYLEGYREKLLKRFTSFNIDYAFDMDWHKNFNKDTVLSRVETALMGSSYCESCHISDGHARLKHAYIPLSNMDVLMVVFWDWYNK